MRNVIHKISSLFLLLTAIIFVSCFNLFSSDIEQEETSGAKGEGTVCIKVSNNPSKARTVNPSSFDENGSFMDYRLWGKPYGSEDEMKVLFGGQRIPEEGLKFVVPSGLWEFTFSASYNGISFSDTKIVDVIADANNTVRFNLKATEHFGGCDITYVLEPQVEKAEYEIKNARDESTIKTAEVFPVEKEGNKSLNIFINPAEHLLASGTYLLTVKFYGGETLLNTNETYLVISDAKISSAVISLDFNKLYTIKYQNPNGYEYINTEYTDYFSGVIVNTFSKKSSFNLPAAKETGKIFLGWQLVEPSGTITDKIISKIPDDIVYDSDLGDGSYGEKTVLKLQALFIDPVLYVADNTTSDATCTVEVGSDENSGYDESHPVKTLEKAFEIIRNLGTAETNWTIQIRGNLPASTISEEDVSADYAKSVKFIGAANLHLNPEDRFDGKKTATSLTVSTPVPVTLTDLKITNGKIGLNVAQGATVILGPGVHICGNMQGSNSRGGGVHNEGTLFMYGNAVVGLLNPTTWASPSSSEQYVYGSASQEIVTGNYATSGGGIYNGQNNTVETVVAKLYLGYSGFDEDGITPVKAGLSGGVLANGASEGAGIYNAPNCRIYYDSGVIRWNDAGSNGAGIYNNKGLVEMTGGQIINNRALWPGYTSNSGGGIYNYHNSARFIMSGGVIKDNTASSKGGGIYNGGKVYIYGTAVIGNEDADTVATADSFGNKAIQGGGIFNDGDNYGGIDYNYRGELYIGYEPGADGVTPVKADYSGGIYQNYSTYTGSNSYDGGGAIGGDAKLKISGGTIAYNYAANNGGAIVYSQSNTTFFEISGGTIEHNVAGNKGGAIYISSGNTSMLTLSGSPSIPAETDGSNDIYITNTSYSHYPKITIGGAIDNAFTARITYGYYDTRMKPLVLGTDVTDTDLATECVKFDFPSESLTGYSGTGEQVTIDAKWYVDETGSFVRYNKLAPEMVGDIVLNDGTAINGKYIGKMTGADNAKAIAVIFYAGGIDAKGLAGVAGDTPGRRLLGVGLSNTSSTPDSGLAWALNGTTGYTTTFSTIISRTDLAYDKDGSDNWSVICDADTTASANAANYPAFNWVNSYTGSGNLGTAYADGWYIPAVLEIKELYKNLTAVNTILAIQGDEISTTGYYWTSNQGQLDGVASSQYAVGYSFADGNINTELKSNTYNVCAVREFNPTIPTTDLVTITKPTYTVLNVTKSNVGAEYTFEATENFAKYTWYVDNEEQTETSNILTLDTTDWNVGIYDIRLEAKLGSSYSSTYYSYTDQLTVSGS